MAESGYCGSLFDLPKIDPGIFGVVKRSVFGPKDKWPDYSMRFFELQSRAEVPRHKHSWPHYVLALQGEARLSIEDEEYALKPMCWAFIPENKEHSFVNFGEETFRFICIVPPEGDVPPKAE